MKHHAPEDAICERFASKLQIITDREGKVFTHHRARDANGESPPSYITEIEISG